MAGPGASRKPMERALLARERPVPPTLWSQGTPRELSPCAWPLLRLLVGLRFWPPSMAGTGLEGPLACA